MKNNFKFVLTIILVSILLCACTTNDYENQQDNPNTDANFETRKLETVIYHETEDSTIFHVSEQAYKKFDAHEYKDSITENTIRVDILGVKYVATYETTVKLPRSDTEVYVYNLKDSEGSQVFIDSKNGNIAEYYNIPYDEQLVNEHDYISFISAVLNNNCNLSEYDYTCTTHYYTVTPSSIESQVVDGFKVCKEENERIGTYSFYYTQSMDGIKLQDHISAEFFGSHFILEVYEYDYEIKDFASIIYRMDEVESNVKGHLTSTLKDGCTITDIKHDKKSIFIQNGIPYVMMTSTVTYKSQFTSWPVSIYVVTITE